MGGRWRSARDGVGRLAHDARTLNRQDAAVERVRHLRRVRPGDPGFGDPLTIAGRDSAAALARIGDRIFVDEPRVSRELRMAGLQVWQALLDRAGHGDGERDLAILFTDLVGFSTWALAAGDDDALLLLRAVARVVEPAVLDHRGRIVKRLGDGLLAVFPSARSAVDAALAALDRVADVEVAGHHPQLRAGVHLGRPRPIGGDYLGVDVNVAARVMQDAGPGELLVSDAVAATLDAERFTVQRKRRFRPAGAKGVPVEIDFYTVRSRGAGRADEPG